MTTASSLLPETLLAHLRTAQEEMVDLLSGLALLESPSRDPGSQEPVLARLAAELGRSGLAVRRLRGRTSGGQIWAAPARSARRRPADPRGAQLLIGHCDTVWPAGTLATMPVERRSGDGGAALSGARRLRHEGRAGARNFCLAGAPRSWLGASSHPGVFHQFGRRDRQHRLGAAHPAPGPPYATHLRPGTRPRPRGASQDPAQRGTAF